MLDLPRQDLVAQPVPALVELAPPACNPLLRHVMRRMRGARCKVDEERPVRRQRLLVADPGHCLVGHVGQEVVIGVIRQLHRVHAVIDEWRPLVRLAAQKAVELVESLVGRPAVERTRDARLPGRELVPLSEGPGAVAVETQDLGQWGYAVRDLAVFPGNAVPVSMIAPMLLTWWLRPLLSAARVGEQTAVVWKLL